MTDLEKFKTMLDTANIEYFEKTCEYEKKITIIIPENFGYPVTGLDDDDVSIWGFFDFATNGMLVRKKFQCNENHCDD